MPFQLNSYSDHQLIPQIQDLCLYVAYRQSTIRSRFAPAYRGSLSVCDRPQSDRQVQQNRNEPTTYNFGHSSLGPVKHLQGLTSIQFALQLTYDKKTAARHVRKLPTTHANRIPFSAVDRPQLKAEPPVQTFCSHLCIIYGRVLSTGVHYY